MKLSGTDDGYCTGGGGRRGTGAAERHQIVCGGVTP